MSRETKLAVIYKWCLAGRQMLRNAETLLHEQSEPKAGTELNCFCPRWASARRAAEGRGQVSLFCLDLRFYQFKNGASISLVLYSVHNTLVY